MDLVRSPDRYLQHAMTATAPSPLVHLELHTPNLGRACAFYAELCGWRPQRMDAADTSYHALDLGPGLGGGIVECGTQRALWLPYLEVDSVTAATERAQALGATPMLDPREGPYGWRSVVTSPAGGELAFWQPKR
jgi:predicted enzyme related to lactoylglutathione lyase